MRTNVCARSLRASTESAASSASSSLDDNKKKTRELPTQSQGQKWQNMCLSSAMQTVRQDLVRVLPDRACVAQRASR